MAEVVLFHHVQGLTGGCLQFAETLREAGHVVHTPDLFQGKTFDSLTQGMAHAEELGFDAILQRGRAFVQDLPRSLVFAGFSLGVMPAQMLAQTLDGAQGALLFHSCVPPVHFGERWPDGVPVQVHMMDGDDLAIKEGDLDAARQLAETVPGAELFLYPGKEHLFADRGLPGYDEGAATLLMTRVLNFLQIVSQSSAPRV